MRVARQVEASFPNRVALAFERGGEVQPRRRILHTMCLSDKREWRSGDVVEEYSELYERPEKPGFLHAAWRARETRARRRAHAEG